MLRVIGPGGKRMKSYMVERDMKGISLQGLGEAMDALQRQARAMRDAGTPIEYVRSAFLPQDGRCMCTFEAETSDAVRKLNDAAGLPYVQVVDCYDLTPERRARRLSR